MVAPAVGLEQGGGEQGTGPRERHDMAGMGGRLSVVLSYLEAKERSTIEHLPVRAMQGRRRATGAAATECFPGIVQRPRKCSHRQASAEKSHVRSFL
jgi:hypothetical protein